jgi:hypothetical protein
MTALHAASPRLPAQDGGGEDGQGRGEHEQEAGRA